MADMNQIARAIVEAEHLIALTGAGVSVPSGISDFRSPHGLWTRYPMAEYGTIEAFRRTPRKVWKLFKELADIVHTARPNPAHLALARLEELGLLKTLVTQNIDNLHQAAGSHHVIEFHGSAQNLSCPECRTRCDLPQARERTDEEGIPHCRCGAILKPDVILFGESIPEEALNSSFLHAQQADLILVAGTSAQVVPASMLPSVVTAHGGDIVEMNLTRTELSPMSRYHLEGDVAQTLPDLLQHVEQLV